MAHSKQAGDEKDKRFPKSQSVGGGHTGTVADEQISPEEFDGEGFTDRNSSALSDLLAPPSKKIPGREAGDANHKLRIADRG